MNGIPKLGNTLYLFFATHNPSTGAVSDADSTPTCDVYEDATDVAILSPTVVKVATGRYRVPIAATEGNGFEAEKSYNAVAAATVNSITANAVVGQFTLAAADTDDIVTQGDAAWITATGFEPAGAAAAAVATLNNLSSQGARDAMKLAPTAGDPEAGSVDKHLDDILEDTSTTLPALINALGPGTGDKTVNVTVTAGALAAGATVSISATATGAVIARATANSLGVATLHLNAGSYFYHAHGVVGYTHTPAAFTVAASPTVQAFAITMTEFVVAAATDPSLRRVWMRIWRADGEYVTGTPAFTVHLDVACKYEDGRLGDRRTVGSTDAADHSYAYADLLPTDALTPVTAGDTVVYRVQIHETGEEETFALPTGDLSSVELASLI